MFAVSVAVAGCNFFIPSTLGVVLFSVSMGFLLSLDLSQITALCCAGPRPASGGSWGRRRGVSPSPPTSSFGWRLGCREILLYVGLLVAAMVEAGLLHHFLAADLPQSSVSGPQVPVVTSYLLLSLFILCWVLGEIQGVYVCGGVFLNPLYPRGISNVQTFNQSSRGLHVAAAVRRVLLNLGEYFAERLHFFGKSAFILLPIVDVYLKSLSVPICHDRLFVHGQVSPAAPHGITLCGIHAGVQSGKYVANTMTIHVSN